MYEIFCPKDGYTPKYGIIDTQREIKFIKDNFQNNLANALNLERISAPLFVFASTGLNDNLTGTERPVAFDVKAIALEEVQVVQSLAKWKRDALARYGFQPGHGLYTDMNAIRRDEVLDNLHSIYVDQWDWELVIEREQRTEQTLREVVEKIYACILDTHYAVCKHYPLHKPFLSETIHFITTQELEDRYPYLSPKERENAICKELGAVFLMQIGWPLRSGIRHDGRSPDYDDWTMNGDILVWYEPLQMAVELSSMGVRVDEHSLVEQCVRSGAEERLTLPYHQALLGKRLPYTIGGGIGQSRLCMLYMEKAHIGEVQASIWPQEMVRDCERYGMFLL
ncbi:MAG: aspartate--ammonia ligase [Clostridiales bacterium]|nr:aspartate--ammonia ligase [Clostridiales bacterium]